MATSSDPAATTFAGDSPLNTDVAEFTAGSAGMGPWRLAWRRLRRNKVALAFGVLFLVLVALALCAPLFANHVAHSDPNSNRLSDQITVHGKKIDVVSLDGV